MALTKLNTSVANHQSLGDEPNADDGLTASELKILYDKASQDIKDFINDILTVEMDALETATQDDLNTLALAITNILNGTSTVDNATKLNGQLASYYATQSDMTSAEGRIGANESAIASLPTTYLGINDKADDSDKLDGKDSTEFVQTSGSQTIADTKTFTSSPKVPTPTANEDASNKDYVDDAIAGVVLGQIPDGSLTDDKLSNDPGQIKDRVSDIETDLTVLKSTEQNTKSAIQSFPANTQQAPILATLNGLTVRSESNNVVTGTYVATDNEEIYLLSTGMFGAPGTIQRFNEYMSNKMFYYISLPESTTEFDVIQTAGGVRTTVPSGKEIWLSLVSTNTSALAYLSITANGGGTVSMVDSKVFAINMTALGIESYTDAQMVDLARSMEAGTSLQSANPDIKTTNDSIPLLENTFAPNIDLRSVPNVSDELTNRSGDKRLNSWLHVQNVGEETGVSIGATINTTTISTMSTSSSFIAIDETNDEVQYGVYGDVLSLTNTATVLYELATPIGANVELDDIYSFENGTMYQEEVPVSIDYIVDLNRTGAIVSTIEKVERLDDEFKIINSLIVAQGEVDIVNGEELLDLSNFDKGVYELSFDLTDFFQIASKYISSMKEVFMNGTSTSITAFSINDGTFGASGYSNSIEINVGDDAILMMQRTYGLVSADGNGHRVSLSAFSSGEGKSIIFKTSGGVARYRLIKKSY